MVKIINIGNYTNFPSNTLYCGRKPDIWRKSGKTGRPLYGNPFKIGAWISRDTVIDAHMGYTILRMQNPKYCEEISNMKDVNLACHCKPERCHCDNYRLLEDGVNIDTSLLAEFIIDLMGKQTNWKETRYSQILRDITKNLIADGSIISKNGFHIGKRNNINKQTLNLVSELCLLIYEHKDEAYMFVESFAKLQKSYLNAINYYSFHKKELGHS